ncbi:MAG: ribokinase [Tepidisphaeraceae bacterium]
MPPPAPRPIVVIGSVNMDLVCRARHMPAPGETVIGGDVATIPGGKGANQAVAAAKLGRNVHLVARVGDDDFGQRLMLGLKHHGVRTRHVTVTEGTASGCAMILVDGKGENSIVVSPGANGRLTPRDIDAAEDLIASAAVVVMQLEIPPETVRHALALCQRRNVYTILDPAPVPARPLTRAFYGVDLFTPNQIEAEALLGRGAGEGLEPGSGKLREPKQVGMALLSRGARTVVLKLGRAGAMVLEREGNIERVAPYKVKVVDTTAAGDAFTAALAVGRAEGMGLVDSTRFANAAGAACCRTFGAQPALPTRADVDALMAKG